TSYGDNIVYTDWRRDNFYHGLQEALNRQGIRAKRIGVEDDTVTTMQRKALADTFSDAELVDVSQAAMRQRMIKSQEEIEVIKQGARIGDIGGEAIHAAIREGITEYEVALIGQEAMVHEIAKTFPDQEVRDTWVWFQSGINTDGAHNWSTTRNLQTVALSSMHWSALRAGYYTALERTMTLGEPDARTLEIWIANVKVHEAAIELIKPGAVCKDIAHELNDIFIGHGLLPNRTF